MDRSIPYTQAQARAEDAQKAQQAFMVGLAKLCEDLFGSTTYISGLSVGANSPAALNVVVQPGQIYSQESLEATAYGLLAADTAHKIVKQGILLDALTLSCPAPSTSGYSIVYLIQAAYEDIDGSNVVLPYYNSSNPSSPLSGPNNAGTPQPTVRQGACTVMAKAGVAATTGSEAAPAVDAGYTGIATVTVTYGDTAIVAGSITNLTANTLPAGGALSKYLTQPLSDTLYAALAGNVSQVFNVANAAAANEAVNFGQTFGFGQTLQNVSRSYNTNYTNSTNRPMMVLVVSLGVGSGTSYIKINGANTVPFSVAQNSAPYTLCFPVNPGDTYQIYSIVLSTVLWAEWS